MTAPGYREVLRALFARQHANAKDSNDGYETRGTGETPIRKARRLFRKLETAIRKGLAASCHDCSEGGLAVALAECCIGGNIGAEVELGSHAGKLMSEQVLFSESAGRFVLSVKKKNEKAFARSMRGTPCARIGQVFGQGVLSIKLHGQELLSLPVSSLRDAWKKTMDW